MTKSRRVAGVSGQIGIGGRKGSVRGGEDGASNAGMLTTLPAKGAGATNAVVRMAVR